MEPKRKVKDLYINLLSKIVVPILIRLTAITNPVAAADLKRKFDKMDDLEKQIKFWDKERNNLMKQFIEEKMSSFPDPDKLLNLQDAWRIANKRYDDEFTRGIKEMEIELHTQLKR